MNDLTVNGHDDEIGFMDDDTPPSSGPPSPRQPASSPSTTSLPSTNGSVQNGDAHNDNVLDKSETEDSEKTGKNVPEMGSVRSKMPVRGSEHNTPSHGGSEFDSECEELGFQDDGLKDSDQE